MDEEGDEERQVLLPHCENLAPVERDVGIGRADGQADDRRQEQHGPHRQVDQRLLPVFFSE